jgi:PleD family two-component response regulator
LPIASPNFSNFRYFYHQLKEDIFPPAPGKDIYVTVSIGLAQYKPQEDMRAFVHRIDQLMYTAKKNGKDRVCPES